MGKASREKWERRVQRALLSTKSPEKTTVLAKDIMLAIVCLLIPQGWSMSGFPPTIIGACVCWAAAVGLVIHALWISVHIPIRYKRIGSFVFVVVIVFLLKTPVSLEYAKEHSDSAAPLPPAKQNYMVNYGPSAPVGMPLIIQGKVVKEWATSDVVVNGDELLPYSNKYRLVAICFHLSPDQQFDFVEDFSRSPLQNIRQGFVTLRIAWNDAFTSEFEHYEVKTNYAVLMLPKEIGDKFVSIADAEAKVVIYCNQPEAVHKT